MGLPENPKAAWPPAELKPVFKQFEVWSTWYSGDADDLSRLYGGSTGGPVNRPSQFAGGVVGTLSRFWWGQPTPATEQRAKLHVPLAGDIAAKSADLLYSEPPTFTFAKGNTAADRIVTDLVDDGLYATLLEAAEVAAALSGVYLRIVWDKEFRALPWITAVHPDAAVPEWRWGQLAAVTFWDVLERDDDDRVVRHLERHEAGTILHAVYDGTTDTIGHRVPLTRYSETAAFAMLDDDGTVIDDQIGTIDTGVKKLTAAYLPNIRPTRRWRNTPAAAPMGRSDFDGIEGLFDAFDEAWSSWMRDLRHGKSRIIVPGDYLQNLGPGQGAAWSAEQEVYQAVKTMPAPDGKLQLETVQFAIRFEEHEATTRAILSQTVNSAGYAAQSFGLGSEVAITATEVSARERQSYITRDKKAVYQRAGIPRLIETLLALCAGPFSETVTPERPRMDFADGVSDSIETTARTLQLIEAARAASTRTKVAMLHPDWEQTEIDQEAQRILDEDGATVRDPISFMNDIATGDADPELEDTGA